MNFNNKDETNTLDIMTEAINSCIEAVHSYFQGSSDGEQTLLLDLLFIGIQTIASIAMPAMAKALDDYIYRTENARKRTAELFNEFNNMNKTLADHKKTVSELANRYDYLSKGVDLSSNKNMSLSEEEYKEFLDINEQLADVFPQLTKEIDENGNSIVALGTNGATSKEQLEELLQAEENLNNLKIAQGLQDAFKGVYTYVEEANEAANQLNSSINDSNEAINRLQETANNGIKLNGEKNQLLLNGNIQNDAESSYLKALMDSVNEFWKSLDGSRRLTLSANGINDTNLFRHELNQDTGAFELYANTCTLTSEEITALEAIIKENISLVNGALLDSVSTQSQKLQEQIQQSENAWTDFIPNLISGMKSKQTFQNLDPDLQKITVQIVEGLDYSYSDAMKKYHPDPYAYIRDKLITPMSNLNDSDKKLIKHNFNKLMTLNPGDISESNQKEVTKLLENIGAILDKNPLEIRSILGLDITEIQADYKTALDKAKNTFGGFTYDNSGFKISNNTGKVIEDFFAENVKTEEDIAIWNKAAEGITDFTKATEAYKKAKDAANSAKLNESQPSYASAISQVQDLSKGLGQLGSIYADVKDKNEFDWSSILNNASFKEQFGDMQNVTGEYQEAYEKFIQVVSSSPNDLKACQSAFNDLATAYIYNSGALQNVTEETKGATISMLEQMGIANANAIVEAELAAQEIQAKIATEGLTEATYSSVQALIEEGNISNATALALFELITQIKVFNATGLSATQKVEEIKRIALAFGIATDSANTYWSTERQLAYAKSKGISEEQFVKNNYTSSYDKINAKFGPIVGAQYTGASNNTTKNKDPKKTQEEQKETKKTIDWISRKFDIMAKQLDVIKKKASEVYSTFKNQNKQIDTAIEKIDGQIEVYNKAYAKYMKKANSVGLDENLVKKVKDGSLNISDYKGKTAEEIEQYKEWYDKAQDVLATITDLKLEQKELARQKLSNIVDDYDRKKSYQEAQAGLRETKMGDSPKEKDYNYLIKKQNHMKTNLKKEYNELNKEFKGLMDKGVIKKYSDSWYEWKEKLVDCKVSLEECDNEIKDLAKSIIELRWEKFDTAIEKLTGVQEALKDLTTFFDADTFDGTRLTKAGMANITAAFQGLANVKQEMADYQSAKKWIAAQLTNGDIDQAYHDERLKELEDGERQAAIKMKEYRDSILDIYIQGIDAETDAMRDLVQAKKDALDAERDLHNYRNSIADKEEDIVILQKKIAELSKSTDRKDIALRLELEEELANAQKDLSEEQYNHNMDLKQGALDQELESFEKAQEEKKKQAKNSLEEQERILNDYLTRVQDNYNSTMEYALKYAAEYGISMSEFLSSPWEKSIQKAKEYKDLLENIGPNVKVSTSAVNTKQNDYPEKAWTGIGVAGDRKKTGQATIQSPSSTAEKKLQNIRENSKDKNALIPGTAKRKFKLNGYKNGVKDLKREELARISENGNGEVILRPGEGLLAPLQQHDNVLTHAQTESLMGWSQVNPMEFMRTMNQAPIRPIAAQSQPPLVIESVDASVHVSGVTRDEINKKTQELVNEIPKKILREYSTHGIQRII